MFERKEVKKEAQKNTFWSILRWYWILVPSFFFIFMLPNVMNESSTGMLEPSGFFSLVFQMTNLGMAGVITAIHPHERSKSGVGNMFTKLAVVHQLLIQNIFGVLLALMTWYQLPFRVDPTLIESDEEGKFHLQSKSIILLTVGILIITLLAVLGQFRLG